MSALDWLFAIVIILVVGGEAIYFYQAGYKDGYAKGHHEGHSKGYQAGYKEAWSKVTTTNTFYREDKGKQNDPKTDS